MKRTRHIHAERARSARRKLALFAGFGAAIIVLIAVIIGAGMSSSPSDAAPEEHAGSPSPDSDASAFSAASEGATVAVGVEVPKLAGRTLAEAHVLLEALGLGVEVIEDGAIPADAVGDARLVSRQTPEPGYVTYAGMAVTVVVPVCSATSAASATSSLSGLVVVIDPGHQSRGDNSPEPIGPGATESKPRVTGGTTGTVTRLPEYEVVLQIAMNLKARLERAGVSVVMTRTTNDVNISNSERAQVANDASARLFIRIHADGSVDPQQAGFSILYPGPNRWTAPIVDQSRAAAQVIHDALAATTGAQSRGLVARDDLTGFNWSRVPSVLVECGFMTNPVEDRLLASPHYQDRLAEAMASGIISYLSR